jgi:hypothetical protein
MKRLSLSLFVAVLCASVAIYDVIRAVLGGGWWFVVAAVVNGALAALNFYFHRRSTRKADKPVATPQYHSGGYVGSADLTKAFAQALARSTIYTNVTAPVPALKKGPERFHGLPFEFAVGEVYGLRMWHMDSYGRLRARNWEGAPPWRPGVNVARCRCVKREAEAPSFLLSASYRWVVDDNPGHEVPSEQCGCGFYAYTDSLHAEVTPYIKSDGEEPVLGVIKGTGRTLIGTQGFRCEKAEIVAFRDPTRGGTETDVWRLRQLARLRRVYPDVPILSSRAELLEFAPLTETLPDPSSDEFWEMS